MTDSLKNKLSDLPTNPGVYFHKDKNGKIIYVGKAAVLRNRVRQYFQESRTRDAKTEALVKDIVDIDWIEVETEVDALFLEAELIKRYKPKYNIDLRDDKSDLYVRIDSKSDHPTVSYTRRPLDDGADYFGSFNSGYLVKKAIKLLRKAFPFDYKVSKSDRVSLDYHIGLSPGLEENKTTLVDYRSNLSQLKRYLKGQRVSVINDLTKEMKQHAKTNSFEEAARCRNQIQALQSLRKQIVFSNEEFMDISKDQALSGLMDLLKLQDIPRRIEGYDISHQSGTNNVASMVVFSNGLPDKTEYKKFKMHLQGNDDFGHMREVIGRRFSKRNLTSWPKPDLLLIDGGKGQLSSAKSVLQELNIDIPAIGLAKRYETIIVPAELGANIKESEISNARSQEYLEIRLPESSHIIKLLQRIRDESHRFAVSYHSSLKIKAQTKNKLEEINGIGPTTRKVLLRQFGSYKKVMEASNSQLAEVVGQAKADLIKVSKSPAAIKTTK